MFTMSSPHCRISLSLSSCQQSLKALFSSGGRDPNRMELDNFTNTTFSNVTENDSLGMEVEEEETEFVILLTSIHDVFLILVLIITMTAMGADITWRQIRDHLRKPIGVSIGLTCQFILVPFVGFILRYILNIQGLTAVGLLIVSCSPGGVVSNIFTYYLDGDVSLSIAMTSMSTLLALGFMPLNTWLYSKAIGSFNFVIPYAKMATSMIYVTSPVAVGILIRWKLRKIATLVTKVGSTLGFVLFLVAMCIELVIYPHIFRGLPMKLYFGMILMPMFGLCMGYCIAWVFRQKVAVRKTVSIESGIQNVVISLAVLSLSFKGQDRKTALTFPLMYGISMLSTCFFISGVYYLYKRCLKKPEKEDACEDITNKETITISLNPVLNSEDKVPYEMKEVPNLTLTVPS